VGLNHRVLRNVNRGQTAWVVGSGRTTTYLPQDFLADKWVVAVNHAGPILGLGDYITVTNHHDEAQSLAEMRPDLLVVTSEVEQVPAKDSTGVPATAANIIKVPTIDQPYASFTTDLHWPVDPDLFAIGPTSLHLAIRLAWYMGAAHVVLVGADCGSIDGHGRVDGYPLNADGTVGDLHYGIWESTLRDIAGRLRRDGVGVVSLNPFATLALEGHEFRN
jgi:hypothetical protein